jgi:hypothetical protein
MLVVNCLLMWRLQGDPFHVFKVSGDGVSAYGARSDIDDSVFLYFRYLFFDIRHTWLLGVLALAGVFCGFARRRNREEHPLLYAGLWAATLIVVFSFTVISTEPLRFVMKQSNYMLLFTAPLCLLAGYFLAHINHRYAIGIAGIYVAGAVALAGLAQQDIHVFRGNSPNAVAYADANPDSDVYATTNAYRLALFERMLSTDRSTAPTLRDLSTLTLEPQKTLGGALRPRVVILDTENLHWGRNPVSSLKAVPTCWRRVGELEPAEIRSAGRYLVRTALAVVDLMPASLRERVRSRVVSLQGPMPAYVFDVPPGCGLPQSKS